METLHTYRCMVSAKSKFICTLKANKKILHKKTGRKRKTKESVNPLLMAGDLTKSDTGTAEVFSAILPQFCLVRLVLRPFRSLSFPAESMRVKQYPQKRKTGLGITQAYTSPWVHVECIHQDADVVARQLSLHSPL